MLTAKLNKEATQFNQPGRTGYLLKMTTEELVQILPTREAEQLALFTDTNRPITPKHLGSIEKFLADTPDWAMPAIVLSARPGNIQTNRNRHPPSGGPVDQGNLGNGCRGHDPSCSK